MQIHLPHSNEELKEWQEWLILNLKTSQVTINPVAI